MVYGVVNLNENVEPLDENDERKARSFNVPLYYWEIILVKGDDPMLFGPLTRHEIFEYLEKEGYEIPFRIKRLRPDAR